MASIISRATSTSIAFLRHSNLGCLRTTALPSIASTSSFLPTSTSSSHQSTLSYSPYPYPSSVSSLLSLQMRSMALSASSEQYLNNKKALKELRTQRYAERQEHKKVVKQRRRGRNKGVRKRKFEAWFKPKKKHEEINNWRSKKLGMDWKIQVAVVLERLPKVLPDKPDWEREWDNLKDYLDQFGREYPEKLMGTHEIMSQEEITDEALLGKCKTKHNTQCTMCMW